MTRIEDLKSYIVEFEEDGKMKPKIYPSGCTIGGSNWQPIIVITHNGYTFFANNGIRRAWNRGGDIFLQPKGCGIQRILEEQQLWPTKSLNLEYPKPKYFNS